MTGGIHLYFKANQPVRPEVTQTGCAPEGLAQLFLQSVMPLKNLLDAKVRARRRGQTSFLLSAAQILQIHLLGKPAEGDLKRPFKVVNALASMLGQSADPADPATIKNLEEKPVRSAPRSRLATPGLILVRTGSGEEGRLDSFACARYRSVMPMHRPPCFALSAAPGHVRHRAGSAQGAPSRPSAPQAR
jgi:hypothetical protein